MIRLQVVNDLFIQGIGTIKAGSIVYRQEPYDYQTVSNAIAANNEEYYMIAMVPDRKHPAYCVPYKHLVTLPISDQLPLPL